MESEPDPERQGNTKRARGQWRQVASATVAEAIAPLTSAPGVQLDVPYEGWGEQRVLPVDGDLIDECDRVNDRTETEIPDPCAGEFPWPSGRNAWRWTTATVMRRTAQRRPSPPAVGPKTPADASSDR